MARKKKTVRKTTRRKSSRSIASTIKSAVKKATRKKPKRKGSKSLSQRDAEAFAENHKLTPRQAADWAKGKRKLWKEIIG